MEQNINRAVFSSSHHPSEENSWDEATDYAGSKDGARKEERRCQSTKCSEGQANQANQVGLWVGLLAALG